ncbi:MAG TPA: S-layer glycoprotein N-glycosyltransferase AglJ [Methanoregulaceae archaeon]|nr:S-layer glycoprotein N-glycosyltransferase AglJ [Methanoregulaceae archaeon]
MSIEKDKVCVLIPTLNEAPTIGGLIKDFMDRGFSHILVIDGHSTDETRKISEKAGARVVLQSQKGKGNAMIEAFQKIEEPYILLIDGDGTYSPADADKLLDKLSKGCDHVIGDRLTEENRKAFSRLNFFGNQVLNRLFKVAHGQYLNDILSGYRAFNRDSILAMNLKETGFGIETEISAESARRRQKIGTVAISYKEREGTPTKLNPFHDGLKITTTIYKLAKISNPLFYFGLIGIIITLAGIAIGIYILTEWFKRIEHLPLTIFTVLLIVVGFQIFMFGVLSDMMLAYHREMIREIHSAKSVERPPE